MHVSPCTQRARTSIVVALLLLGPVGVDAQGFYYREIAREGRIYAFNDAARADRFMKTGEMARAITGPAPGPNGEIVIGDSERALQLFYFRHGIAQAVPEPPQPRVEWRDGKTRIGTGTASLEISNRVQVRYTHEMPDAAVHLGGTGAPGDSRGSFRIRRAKLKLEGWFWEQDRWSYELQVNWPAAGSGSPADLLEDASLAFDTRGDGSLRIRVGQFKAPIGRQQLTSSGNQQFADRALVANEYARGRETGAAVQGVLFGNRLEYRAGLFNGNGLTRSANDNDSFQYNARLMWQPNGQQDLTHRAWVSGSLYSESDFESATVPLYAVAVNVERSDTFHTNPGPLSPGNRKWTIASLDGVFKYAGAFATGEYFWRRNERQDGLAFRDRGWYLQGGQMLDADRQWEVAARYGRVDRDDAAAADDAVEMRVGFSYYYRRHTLKFQADAGQVDTTPGPGAAIRKSRDVRVQTQFVF